MALPIRLIVGPSNLMEIPLDAQSVDIVVDRNASAFPTPNNIVGRVAIDTNTPTIGIDIAGILQDDDVSTVDITGSTAKISGGDIIINFASGLPTTNFASNWDIIYALNNYTIAPRVRDFTFQTALKQRSSSMIFLPVSNNIIDSSLLNSLRTSAISAVDHPSAGTYSKGTTSVVVDSASNFRINSRIHKSTGAFVGTLTSIGASQTLVFSSGIELDLDDGDDLYSYGTTIYNHAGQAIGSVIGATSVLNTIKLDQIAIPVSTNEEVYIVTNDNPPIEANLDEKEIHLFPNHWRKSQGSGGGFVSSSTKVILKFSTDMAHSDYQNKPVTSGDYPSITQQGRVYSNAILLNGVNVQSSRFSKYNKDVIVKVPIGGITTHSVNGNPASTLALIVKKALELTADAMLYGNFDSTNGQTIPDAFTCTTSGPIIKINQKVPPLADSLLCSLSPCLSPERYVSNTATLATFQHFNTGHYTASVNGKSAGDKVQDLVGLVSNAKKNVDLIRGLQIPYDSLIQSDAVTPTARNFFLTFGRQDNAAKGSANNTLNASHPMEPGMLSGDLGGDSATPTSNFFSNFGNLGDTAYLLGAFAVDFVADTFLTLLSDPHGNDGGIRIIPEKLHVRYDAGNNYYAYNLRLLASDFVIGV